jgi:hypothetical protein
MKRLLSIILCLVMALSLVACGNDKVDATNPSVDGGNSDIGETPTQNPTDGDSPNTDDVNGKYKDTSGLYQITDDDYDQFYGKIDKMIFYGLTGEAVYADGILYDKDTDDDWEQIWKKWVIGDDKDIVLFDGAILVVENADKTLTVYGSTGYNSTTFEKQLVAMPLNCSRDNFVHGFHPMASANFVCIYKEGDKLYHQSYDLLAQTVSDVAELAISFDGEQTQMKGFFAASNGMRWQLLSAQNELYLADMTIMTNVEGIARVEAWKNECIANVEKYYATYSVYGNLLQIVGDNKHIYFCPDDAENASTDWYLNAAKIAMPEDYTLDDIIECSFDDEMLLKFGDGIYYRVDLDDVKDAEAGEVVQMEQITGFEILFAEGHVVQVIHGDRDIIFVMDDGFIYKIW